MVCKKKHYPFCEHEPGTCYGCGKKHSPPWCKKSATGGKTKPGRLADEQAETGGEKPAEPKKTYYPAPPATKPEPLPEAKRLTAPGTALGAADKKNGNVAEWYLTNFRVRFAREDGSWFDPDIEDFGGEPCPGC